MSELSDWARRILSMPQDDIHRAIMPETWAELETWSFEPRDYRV